jgi:SET domain-containing protein
MQHDMLDVNHQDYIRIIESLSLSKDIAEDKLKNPTFYKECRLLNTEVRNSNIEGLGLFAKNFIEMGSIIESATIDNYTTQAGRYLNHSLDANAYIYATGDYLLIAIRDIHIDEEITADYRQVFRICYDIIIKD